ncbi:MAG TPA: MerR family transcriptional regulator [Caldithrix abyssi]|uniref:MerR family transcriptional regulator n=1 Tax=Caldithrix abyssi TaxID=187145 RepID=A0A7V4U2S9_CALAY|nr:MerR family transcriptional regulator [Caldithrix abyssi]
MIDKYSPVFSISVVAKMINVSVQTVRLYEEKGLILPYKSNKGTRKYSLHDVNRLKIIRRMITTQGLNLNGVRLLLSFIPCWCFKGGFDEDCQQCPAGSVTFEPCWTLENVGKKCLNQDCRACPVYRLEINEKNIKDFLARQ